MIQLKNIHVRYGNTAVLKDISLTAKPGTFIALLGPNGSGKSTLLKSIGGLLKPSSGQITLDTGNIISMNPKQRARNIAYLAQGREAAPGIRVSDILEIGRAPYRGQLGQISLAGVAAMEKAATRSQIQSFMPRRFDSLSGGEQARVLMARALTVNAPVLLADEPIAALDPFYQISTMETLRQEADDGKIVIAALHDLALAYHFADEVWVLSEGKVAAAAPPPEALSVEILQAVFDIKPPQHGFQMMQRA